MYGKLDMSLEGLLREHDRTRFEKRKRVRVTFLRKSIGFHHSLCSGQKVINKKYKNVNAQYAGIWHGREMNNGRKTMTPMSNGENHDASERLGHIDNKNER